MIIFNTLHTKKYHGSKNFISKSIISVRSLYMEVMNDYDSKFKLVALLESLSLQDKYFTYNFAFNKKKNVLGLYL